MAYSKKEIESLFKIICNRIEQGEALRTILLEKDMPESHTFYKWIDNDETKLRQYARATESRADHIFEECLEIADKQGKDVIKDKDGNEITNHNIIQRSRLQVDTRKWMAGKLRPKKYGDKQEISINAGVEIKGITFDE